jgi:phage internal scaffolding protein
MKPFIRTPYNYDTKQATLDSGLTTPEQTLAKQEFKDECDINNVMLQYARTGELPYTTAKPSFGDFRNARTYQESMNLIIEAQNSFKELPAMVRAQFNNDPSELIDFLNNPANKDQAIELGLIDGEITGKPVEKDPQMGEPAPT